MEDELLGRLSKDACFQNTWKGSFAYDGRQIEVSLDLARMPLEPCLVFAKAVISEITQIDERAKNATTDDMLELYNENWRFYGEPDEDDEVVEAEDPELTRDEFKSRLALRGISVHGDSSVCFDYDLGDLFAGHGALLTSVTPACRNFHVELVG